MAHLFAIPAPLLFRATAAAFLSECRLYHPVPDETRPCCLRRLRVRFGRTMRLLGAFAVQPIADLEFPCEKLLGDLPSSPSLLRQPLGRGEVLGGSLLGRSPYAPTAAVDRAGKGYFSLNPGLTRYMFLLCSVTDNRRDASGLSVRREQRHVGSGQQTRRSRTK